MNTLKAINTLLITALALGSLASTATVAYQVSTATVDQAETAVSAFARDSEVAQTRGLRNDEAARLEISRATATDYAIIVADRTAQWQLDEVRSLKSGLDRIADRLSELTGRNGQRLMKRLFKGVAFYRDRKWRGNIAYTIGGTVSFYDVWAGYDDMGRAFYLAHELGHVLDAHDSPLHLFLGEVSQAFSRSVDAYTDGQGGYHLGRNYPLRDPRDRPRHRTDNAAEDWAESFATVVVPAFEADLRDIGAAREQEVQHLLVLWVEQIEARQQRLLPRVTKR